MGKVKVIYLTFDVDFVNYIDGSNIDELDITFDNIKSILKKFPNIKTTWFIRIDGQIENLYGSADFLYNKHEDKVQWLINNGHKVGWHHHSYTAVGNKWAQNTDEQAILEEISKYGTIALDKGMNICRMGWGYQTNKTIQLVDKMGFVLDSSAIPRPNYKWDLSVKDWTFTKHEWYHPSLEDYRIAGTSALSLIEAPMSTVLLPMDTDTEPNVIRYVNPAYHHEHFIRAFEQIKTDKAITITHPYELAPNKGSHSLLAFSMNALEDNFRFMEEQGCSFHTLG